MNRSGIRIPLFLILPAVLGTGVLAGPISDHYELKQFGFGAGGEINATSSGYSLFGLLGEQNNISIGSSNFSAGPGLTYTLQANLPPAPTFTNPGSTYNRLKIIINTSNHPTDATFAVAITSDNWSTTKYIKSDFNIGNNLTNTDWMTYAAWGASNGKYITGLQGATVYKVKVKARTGDFTESAWSAEAQASTITPSLSFGLSNSAVEFDLLTSANNWTDTTKSTTITTSTNAVNGYTIFARESGLLTDSSGETISDYPSPNANPTTWTGIGFGYTTSDSSLIGNTPDRFTNNGPKYAGFVTSAPGDPVADHQEPIVETPVTNETFTVSYRITANEDAIAGQYQNSIIYVAVPVY